MITRNLTLQVPYGCTAMMGEVASGHWTLFPPPVFPATYSGIMEFDWRVLL